jgi:hypothetical protein
MSRNIGVGQDPPESKGRPAGNGATSLKTSRNNSRSAYSQPAAALQADAIRRLRRQRQIERIHGFGARVVYELVDELDRHHELGADLDWRLARYASLDPAILKALSGDRFPPTPIRATGEGR